MSTDKRAEGGTEGGSDRVDVNDGSAFSETLNGTPEVQRETLAGIPSVNGTRGGGKGGRPAKAILLVLVGALTVGGVVMFVGNMATSMKNDVKSASNQKSKNDEKSAVTALNPEGGKQNSEKRVALGAAGVPVASAPSRGTAPALTTTAAQPGSEIRPLRGADGKVMLNAQGKALGVDANGNMVEVPPIVALGGETSGDRKPLPNTPSTGSGSTGSTRTAGSGGTNGAAEKKPPSRFGGALHADGSDSKGGSSSGGGSSGAQMTQTSYGGSGGGTSTGAGAAGTGRTAGGVNPMYNEVLGKLMSRLDGAVPGGAAGGQTAAAPTTAARGGAGAQEGGGSGPVSSQLTSSATPVAYARRTQQQSLMLPKGRQADCVLTTRIINELPGFTSCILDSDLYGADGKVKLLEKGSDIIGEYGTSGQVGLRRLFIVWTRARTPSGVEIDLQSPGSDSLGTSGVSGYLEQRWFERIGAALLISVMKDTIALATAKETGPNNSVVVQPGQNTQQTGQNIAEQVLRQTINTKPTLYINQGERVSVSVARDLDFSTVYTLSNVESNVTAKGR